MVKAVRSDRDRSMKGLFRRNRGASEFHKVVRKVAENRVLCFLGGNESIQPTAAALSFQAMGSAGLDIGTLPNN